MTESGDEVLIELTLLNGWGRPIETTEQPNGLLPLRVVVGKGYLIPALDSLLIGRFQGDTVRAVIPPQQTFGGQGAWYVDHSRDTVFIVRPEDTVRAEIVITKVSRPCQHPPESAE